MTNTKLHFIAKRLEPIELLSEEFDGNYLDQKKKRILIFAQPRTASFTLCRYFLNAGWGIPTEYLYIPFMEILWPRFVGSTLERSGTRSDLQKYIAEIERRRTINGIFSIKLMWESMARFQMAFDINDAENKKYTIYLRREDFQAQVISFFMTQKTGVYSISANHITNKFDQTITSTAEALKRCAMYLIKEEKSWFSFFKSKKFEPLIVRSETLTENPILTFQNISSHFGIPYNVDNIIAYSPFEEFGRYAIQNDEKTDLKCRYFDLLSEFSLQREIQFKKLLSDSLWNL